MNLWQRWKKTAVHNKAMVLTSILVAFGTLFYAAAAVFQIVLVNESSKHTDEQIGRIIGNVNWMARAMDETAKETERNNRQIAHDASVSIKATQEQLRLDQRAWVGIDVWKLEKFEVGQPIGLSVMVMNRGKTPALDVKVGLASRRIISNDHSPEQVDKAIQEEIVKASSRARSMAPITPSNGERFDFDSANNPPLDQGRFDAVSKGVSTWYTVGKIAYKDVFSRQQWMTFCLKLIYVGDHPVVLYCDTGNDMSH